MVGEILSLPGVTQPSIEHVPPEVLTEVFLYCLPAIIPRGQCKPSTKAAPLLLCQVCSQWRSIALSTASLWNNVHIQLSRHNPKSSIQMAQTWFQRAGTPISLSLDIAGSMDFDPLSHLILVPYAARFRHLEICCAKEKDHSLVFTLGFNELESLAVSPAYWGFDFTALNWEHAPKLRKLSVPMVTSMSLYRETLMPWGQLTHLIVLRPMHVGVWVEMLARCVNLQQGSFEIEGMIYNGVSDDDRDGSPVVLDHLRDLDLIVRCRSNELLRPIRQLHFPALRTFRFCDSSRNVHMTPFNWEDTTNFYTQLQSITSLCLRLQKITAQQLVDILYTASDLVSLEIDSTLNYDVLLHALAHSPDLVPKLESVKFHLAKWDILQFTAERFVNMVGMRQPLGSDDTTSCLRYIALSVPKRNIGLLDQIHEMLGPRSHGEAVRDFTTAVQMRDSDHLIFPTRRMEFWELATV